MGCDVMDSIILASDRVTVNNLTKFQFMWKRDGVVYWLSKLLSVSKNIIRSRAYEHKHKLSPIQWENVIK
jgi:hypothetical protein